MNGRAHDRIAELVELWTGIELTRGGAHDALARFLARRMPRLGLDAAHSDRYLGLLGGPSSAEFQELVDAVTVTHTWFMRDADQLEVIAQILTRRPPSEPPLSVWIPGCATGEDAYAIALIASRVGRPVNVLGTDLNRSALAHARRGHYGSWSLRELPTAERASFASAQNGFGVPAHLRKMVTFAHHNLLDPPAISPHGRPHWDVILCRNVLIYFTHARAKNTLAALGEALAPDGALIVGASDIVLEPPPNLRASQYAGKLVFYRRDRLNLPSVTGKPLACSRLAAPPSPRAVRGAAQPVPLPSTSTSSRTLPAAVEVDDALISGHARLERGELAPALEAYRLATERDPLSGLPRMYVGIVLHLMGRLEDALRDLRAASFLSPSLWPASFYLALCYESLGRLDEAQREYRHVAHLRHTSEDASFDFSTMAGPFRGFGRDLVELAERRAERGRSTGR